MFTSDLRGIFVKIKRVCILFIAHGWWSCIKLYYIVTVSYYQNITKIILSI
ncbi:hypothetical protein HanIR_Chr05g0240201 [Helianthus annuus]|nr:hypothetical protein HanIR_Chr05g0240201 [Helianthus annuus]